MNKVLLMGRLTADPDFRQTQNGTAVCRFTIAVNRKFVDKQTGERQAEFISCTAWSKTAEFVSRYFRKGQMIAIEGELRQNNYQDKKYPDVMHYTYVVWVDSVEFAGSKPDNGNSSPPPNQQTTVNSYADTSGYQSFNYGNDPF